MSNYFRFPFATAGDITTIPDGVQGDGSVSFEEGYGDEYSLDLSVNPDARAIERESFNYLMNRVTSAIRFQQQNSGYPEFITTADNGGTAYNYPQGSRVVYSGVLYQAKEATTAIPTDATKWDVVDTLSGVAPLTITDAQIKANAGINAAKIGGGNVSNTEFDYLNGVTAAIQTQLNGKQAAGNYITGLTGDVVGSCAGNIAVELVNTGVTAGLYPNANITVDAKGRVLTAEAGPSPFDLYDSFEIWSSGMPQDWVSAESAEIEESALHVTQGTKSVNLNATGEVTMTKTVSAGALDTFGELVLDVYIGSITAGANVTLSCGANTISTPNGATGTFTLRCPVTEGDTEISISISDGGSAWVDNLRSVLKVMATGVAVDTTGFEVLSGTNLQSILLQIDELVANSLPAGTVLPFAMDEEPDGWYEGDGSEISRAAHPELFAKIGTTYGAGDGSTTFNLPDFRGQTIRGWDNGAGVDAGRVFGSLQLDAIQDHTHWGVFFGSNASGALDSSTGSGVPRQGWSALASDEGNSSGDQLPRPRTAEETRMRNVAQLICIKY